MKLSRNHLNKLTVAFCAIPVLGQARRYVDVNSTDAIPPSPNRGERGQPTGASGRALAGGEHSDPPTHGYAVSMVGPSDRPRGLALFRALMATTSVVIPWPWAGAKGWLLQSTNALPSVAAPWPQIPPPCQTNGANLQFTEPTPVGNKFYRLHKP